MASRRFNGTAGSATTSAAASPPAAADSPRLSGPGGDAGGAPPGRDVVETHQFVGVDGDDEDMAGVRTQLGRGAGVDGGRGGRLPEGSGPPAQHGYRDTAAPPDWGPRGAGAAGDQPPPTVDPTTARAAQFCPPAEARDIQWNWTRAGETEVLPCPKGARGSARWRCRLEEAGPRRRPRQPDLSECRSRWLSKMESELQEQPDVLRISSDLARVTGDTTLYGGDLDAAVRLITKLPLQLDGGERFAPDPRQYEADVKQLTERIVRTTSNLLSKEKRAMWTDLSRQEQAPVMTSLMLGVEENAFLLGASLVEEKSVVQESENMVMSVRLLTAWGQGAIEFLSPSRRAERAPVNDYVRIPRESLRADPESGRAVVVFVSYEGMDEILRPPAAESPSAAQPVVNSRVISASIGKGRHVQLPYPALLVFGHLRTRNVTNPRCVYWDYHLNAWSQLGCRLLATNSTHTQCECDHLTNFAVLMDVHATPLPEADRVALQIITWIGCGISIVCLVLAIITFQFFRALKSDRNSIHKNLCFCLLVGEIIFLAGIGQTHLPVVCGVVAGLLHYFFLCAFAWMFFEGFQLYVMLVEVFEAEKSRIRWYYLAAYGLPAVVVAVSCIVDHTNYGTSDYCWLRADNYFILAFVGPVVVVILANLVFLALAVSMMCRHSVATVTMKSKEQSRLSSASDEEESVITMKMKAHIAWIPGAVALVFLLGLTWSLGLFYINQRTVQAAYAFTVLNSLQGLFIFFFHCVQNEKTRSEYRRFFSQLGWLPACLRPAANTKEQTSSYYASNTHSNAQTSHAAGSPTTYLANMWTQPEEDPTKCRSVTTETRATHGSLRTPAHRALTRDKTSSSLRSHGGDSGNGGSAPDSPPRLNNYPLQELPPGSLVQNPDFFAAYSQQRWRPSGGGASHQYVEVGEPVYEEIDREPPVGGGDLSDEEVRRQSDISRQSSRSCGDSRPLIPYYPQRPLDEPQRRLAVEVALASPPQPPPPQTVPYGVEALAGRRQPVSPLCESNLRDFNQRQVINDLQHLQQLQQLQAVGRHLAAPPVAHQAPAGAVLVPAARHLAVARTDAAGHATAHNV